MSSDIFLGLRLIWNRILIKNQICSNSDSVKHRHVCV